MQIKKTRHPVLQVADIYIKNRVARSSAALSYSLTLSMFPLLICLSIMLGSLDLSVEEIAAFGKGIIPESALGFIEGYFSYAAEGNHRTLFAAGIMALLASSSAAFRSLENTMADIHGASPSPKFYHLLLSFVFSIVFLVSIYISCGIILSGKWIFMKLSEYFELSLFASIWNWLRFLILFVIMYFIILGVYSITAPVKHRQMNRGTGAFIAAVALVSISMLFSWFIEMSTRYTLIYGSLASIIILMMWFYICGIVLILGNAVNVVIDGRIEENRKKDNEQSKNEE
jgi:membrane protein